MLRRIVVVGNGIAGLTAADTLRSRGFDGDLTIVGVETRSAYSRPALSKALLRSDADLTSHELPPPEHGATELLGVGAVGLDPERRLVSLSDRSELPYDGLVIASGSRARRLGGGDELVLRTLDDALLLRDRLASRPHLVVVGGGPLGMEAASAAIEAGCRVTLVTTGQPMATLLGTHLSNTIIEAARQRGLTIVLTGEARVADRGGRPVVLTSEGGIVEGDVVLTAVGDVPNTEWLASSGLVAGGALVVDTRCRVRDDIVAAGDVAAVPTAFGPARSPLWHSAIEQARVAVAALLDGQGAAELHAQQYFWTEQFDLTVRVAGPTPLRGEPELVDGDGLPGSALLRWRHDDGMASAVAVNYRIPVPRLRRLCEPVLE
jgi:3-phenylpropionate/trans-cinnamate dioxygenase ferredoxin reductase subunit